MSLGWIGLLMIAWKGGVLRGLVARFAAVGRMAFSCYISKPRSVRSFSTAMDSGPFGRVDRLQQMLFTFGVWVILLIAAPLWLARFRYGPLEWLWRSLTYGRIKPMK